MALKEKNPLLPWSWTRLSAFETCPFRLLKVNIQRVFSEGESEQLAWGGKVHKAIEIALKPVTKGKPPGKLPDDMAPFQVYVDRLAKGEGELLVENKYALTKDFRPADYFSPVAWYRGQADAVRICGPVALAVDWKTGKRKIGPENKQLMLMAQCIFSHHPDVQVVRSKFIWLNEGLEDDETYTRQRVAEEWAANLLPRVESMLFAAEKDAFNPKPSGLCKSYCPVTSCQFHGVGSR